MYLVCCSFKYAVILCSVDNIRVMAERIGNMLISFVMLIGLT